MNNLKTKHKIIVAGFWAQVTTAKDDIERFKKAEGLLVEDPWERVKMIFKKDTSGKLHPELSMSIQAGYLGLVCGTIYEGCRSSKKGVENFLRVNDANVYPGAKTAARKLNDVSIINFAKGALRGAPKYAILFGTYSLICSCVETYNNKSGIIEYSTAGVGVGALFRFSFGLRGMIAGGVVGGILGTIYGVISWGLLTVFGLDKTEIKNMRYALARYNEYLTMKGAESLKQAEANKNTSEADKLLNMYKKIKETDPDFKVGQ